jgi:dTDP-3,4-didehydro-2,6-dideoxy-alpha-D-glucose 3-reductase
MIKASQHPRLSIAVHGIGAHAQRTVLPAIDQCDAVQLVGISTRNTEVRDAQSAAWSCPSWSTLDEMLASVDPDVVFIASPIRCHFEDGQKVLEAGRHLWCEKSFTHDTAQATTLVETATSKDLAICVSMAPVYHHQFQMLKALIKDNAIGKLRSLSSQFAFPHIDSDNSKYDPDAAGGALLDMGYYPILMAAELLDEMPQLSSAVLETENGYAVDTGGAALLKFTSGVTATSQWGYGRDYINEMTVVGETGTIIAKPVFSKPAHLKPQLTLRRQNAETDYDIPTCNQFAEMLSAFTLATTTPDERRQHRERSLKHQNLLAQVAAMSDATS